MASQLHGFCRAIWGQPVAWKREVEARDRGGDCPRRRGAKAVVEVSQSSQEKGIHHKRCLEGPWEQHGFPISHGDSRLATAQVSLQPCETKAAARVIQLPRVWWAEKKPLKSHTHNQDSCHQPECCQM